MGKVKTIFQKAYTEGLTNSNIDFDSWLEQYGVSEIKLSKLIDPSETSFFQCRTSEIERIAQFIGKQERKKEFSILNIVGFSGTGKTFLLKTIFDMYKEINTDKKIHFWNAEEFSNPITENTAEIEFEFENKLTQVDDNEIILIDNCEKDISHMKQNIEQLSMFKSLVILSWDNLSWQKFKLDLNTYIDLGEPLYLNPFPDDELIELIKLNLKKISIIKDNPILSENAIIELAKNSFGIPNIAINILIKSIKRCYQNEKTNVDELLIKELFNEYGYDKTKKFLDDSKPIIKKILKIISINKELKGASIDKISDEVELDRTTVFYHIKKIRNEHLLDEKNIGRLVVFSLNDKYLPLIQRSIWEERVY